MSELTDLLELSIKAPFQNGQKYLYVSCLSKIMRLFFMKMVEMASQRYKFVVI